MNELIEQYVCGTTALQTTITGLTSDQLRAHPIAGTWSILELLCHLADSEAVFADRMKRILAEDQPLLPFADPQRFAPALAYLQRDAQVEVGLFALTRRQMATILRASPAASFARIGIHSQAGPCTLEQVLRKSVTHLEHHIVFVEQKRRVLLGDVRR